MFYPLKTFCKKLAVAGAQCVYFLCLCMRETEFVLIKSVAFNTVALKGISSVPILQYCMVIQSEA